MYVETNVYVIITWYFSYTTGMENMDTTATGQECELDPF